MSEVETAEEDRSQCEPRSNLLWRIVGQATSADWQHSSRQSAKHSQGCPRLQTVHTADSPASDEYNDSQQNAARLLEQQSHEKQTPIAAELSSEELGATAVASIVYHGRPQAAGYSDHQTCWRQLPVEVVPAIAAAAGDPAVLLRLSGVCRGWREAVLGDASHLRTTGFAKMHACQWHGKSKRSLLPLPAVACKAAAAGNASACVTAAEALDALGMPAEGAKFWGKAARAGSADGQVLIGQMHYTGQHGVARDPEEALRWLARGTRSLLHLTPPQSLLTAALKPARSIEGMVRSGAFLLGLLHLDGEASKSDAGEAVRWLRLAAKYGSREAPALLGTLFNTGQY